MNDRKLIKMATNACAKNHAGGRKDWSKLAHNARELIKSKHGISRAREKADADISRAEAVAS